MQVYVNDRPVELLPGMSVRHALLGAGLLHEMGRARRVFDAWGNQLGLDGAVAEGTRLYVR